MARQRKATPDPAYLAKLNQQFPSPVPAVRPEVGAFYNMRIPYKGEISTRLYLVTKIGRRYIHLYYSPSLSNCRIKRDDWLKYGPVRIPVDAKERIKKISAEMELWDRVGIQYSRIDANKTLAVLRKAAA